MKNNAFILIEFIDGQAQFDIRTEEDAQILTAMLGLEGYFGGKSGLDSQDIREIMDEMKDGVVVKPKDPLDDVTDVEVEDG